MKKTLFTLTVLMASAISFAQDETVTQKLTSEKVKAPTPVSQALSLAQPGIMPMRSESYGNYYKVPTGALYYGFDEGDKGYYATLVNIPALVTGVFKNMNEDPYSAVWLLNGADANMYGVVNSDNDFFWTGEPNDNTSGSYYPAPELQGPNDSYKMPNNQKGNQSGIITIDRISPLTYCDSHIGNRLFGYSSFMSTQYIFGSGNATIADLVDGDTIDVTYPSFGVKEHFTKPMSPLYVESVFMPVLSANGNSNPLGDKTLTMTITGDSGKEIATLTTTQADLINKYNSQTLDPFGIPTTWTAKFMKKVNDPVFGEMNEPFVIDEAFTITITGFDQEGVDLGCYGLQFSTDNSENGPLDVERANMMLRRPDGSVCERQYGSNIALPITFNALTDNVVVKKVLSYLNVSQGEIKEYDNSNVLRITDDGQTSYLDNEAEEGLWVQTATPWKDGGYSIELVSTNDDSEWLDINNPLCDDEYWEESLTGRNQINFTATPIESGKGRWAVLKVIGRGVEAEEPIIILQGTATLDDVTTGIENVVNSTVKADPNAPVYNLSGQRVSKTAKGILIQNGKKFIRK